MLSLNQQVDDLQGQLRGAPAPRPAGAGCCCEGALCRLAGTARGRRGPGGLLGCGTALAEAGLGAGQHHRVVLAADGADIQAALAGMQEEEAGAQVRRPELASREAVALFILYILIFFEENHRLFSLHYMREATLRCRPKSGS